MRLLNRLEEYRKTPVISVRGFANTQFLNYYQRFGKRYFDWVLFCINEFTYYEKHVWYFLRKVSETGGNGLSDIVDSDVTKFM